ncbi:MAG: hypothetical protein J0I79_20065 [Mesorhizobium sp.]|uniref:hypothetical protein n=1 Tax=Mesorhizobium sp. TaxID=1871066 RepID=UPI001AC44288|nr:hypothetical protein [Mesorhizobium sp.]MBN9220247.1 hypothetical protein [Mesorhizobium sp.]
MQITSNLTATIQKLVSARSGLAGQPTDWKAGMALRAEAPVVRPGAVGNQDDIDHDPLTGMGDAPRAGRHLSSTISAPLLPTTTADDPYLRAGKANYDELHAEYTRFIGSMVEADRQHKDSTVPRYFIPAGQTAETVTAMDQHDYMWAVQDEMEAAADRSPQAQAYKAYASEALNFSDASRMTSDALLSLQKALPDLNAALARTAPEAVEQRQQGMGDDPKRQLLARQLASNEALSARSNLRYVDRLVKSIGSGLNHVTGDILVKNDQGQYQLGTFSISFNGEVMLTSGDSLKAFAG